MGCAAWPRRLLGAFRKFGGSAILLGLAFDNPVHPARPVEIWAAFSKNTPIAGVPPKKKTFITGIQSITGCALPPFYATMPGMSIEDQNDNAE